MEDPPPDFLHQAHPVTITHDRPPNTKNPSDLRKPQDQRGSPKSGAEGTRTPDPHTASVRGKTLRPATMRNLLVIVFRSVPLNAVQDRSNDINSPVFSGFPSVRVPLQPAKANVVPHRSFDHDLRDLVPTPVAPNWARRSTEHEVAQYGGTLTLRVVTRGPKLSVASETLPYCEAG